MLKISQQDVERRLAFDNPWWGQTSDALAAATHASFPERAYVPRFAELVSNRAIQRAIILMGPRRVGKTVMLHQTIGKLLAQGVPGRNIMFLSLDTPIYTDTALESFVVDFSKRFAHAADAPLTVIFDEVQYLKDWEVHLKSLVDSYPSIRFVASGSAAAALRLKSRESGAGRFTEFLLPPLTFAEYLKFVGKEQALIAIHEDQPTLIGSIEALNAELIDYLNVGGYPEAVLNPVIREQSAQFIKSDIIDKVLMRDLPHLYGIRDIQELNRLFTVLAYNTGNEVSLDELSKNAGVAKTTLSRYLEYLEAAFLIRRVHRIDQNARHFERARMFKVYLTNPSMRSALFGPLSADDEAMGSLAETALFAQYFHHAPTTDGLHYARWNKGEIDLVMLDPATQKPAWATEVKWSDLPSKDPRLLRHLQAFAESHPSLEYCEITTRTVTERLASVHGVGFDMTPTAWVVYTTGRVIVDHTTRPLPGTAS